MILDVKIVNENQVRISTVNVDKTFTVDPLVIEALQYSYVEGRRSVSKQIRDALGIDPRS